MFSNKKVLALIPARAGSKRIKNKNLKMLGKHPLIFYTIKYALQNKKILDKIIVSTDSKKIQSYSNKFGNLAPFLRPKNIANDKSSDLEFVEHAYNWVKKKEKFFPDIIVILRPTTPFRKKNLIQKCLRIITSNNIDSVRSAKNVGHIHPYWMYKKNSQGFLKEIIPGKNFHSYYQSQLLPRLYQHDGYCDIFYAKNLSKKYNNKNPLLKIYGKKMMFKDNTNSLHLNIDTNDDFRFAKFILKKKYA